MSAPTFQDGVFVCPIHGNRVIVRDGRPLGKCWGCVEEAVRGYKLVEWRTPAAVTAEDTRAARKIRGGPRV